MDSTFQALDAVIPATAIARPECAKVIPQLPLGCLKSLLIDSLSGIPNKLIRFLSSLSVARNSQAETPMPNDARTVALSLINQTPMKTNIDKIPASLSFDMPPNISALFQVMKGARPIIRIIGVIKGTKTAIRTTVVATMANETCLAPL